MAMAGIARTWRLVRSFLTDESGVTAIEYGLLGALLAVAAVGGITLVGDRVLQMYTYISAEVSAALAP